MKIETVDMMLEILSEYHELMRSMPVYDGPMYVTKSPIHNGPRCRWDSYFFIRPFGSYKQLRKEYIVRRDYDDYYWIFMEIPF